MFMMDPEFLMLKPPFICQQQLMDLVYIQTLINILHRTFYSSDKLRVRFNWIPLLEKGLCVKVTNSLSYVKI
jgi:hypothetical protein